MYCIRHKIDLGEALRCQKCLEDDAGRYRWLRDDSLGQWEHPIVVEQRKAPFNTMQYIGPLCGEKLDEAVDAARKAVRT